MDGGFVQVVALSVKLLSQSLVILLIFPFPLRQMLFHMFLGIFESGDFVGRLDLQSGMFHISYLHLVLDLVSLELCLLQSTLQAQLVVIFDTTSQACCDEGCNLDF